MGVHVVYLYFIHLVDDLTCSQSCTSSGSLSDMSIFTELLILAKRCCDEDDEDEDDEDDDEEDEDEDEDDVDDDDDDDVMFNLLSFSSSCRYDLIITLSSAPNNLSH